MTDVSFDPQSPELLFENSVFIIPLDAPLPVELQSLPLPTGTLLNRLAPLGEEPKDGTVALVPLSGSEFLELERPWRRLQVAKKVAVLEDLPGAKYDIIFQQARRQIGLRTVQWPTIIDALAAAQLAHQRTRDKQPWAAKDSAPKLEGRGGDSLVDAERILTPPPEPEEED
jgi:hypothetical protein